MPTILGVSVYFWALVLILAIFLWVGFYHVSLNSGVVSIKHATQAHLAQVNERCVTCEVLLALAFIGIAMQAGSYP